MKMLIAFSLMVSFAAVAQEGPSAPAQPTAPDLAQAAPTVIPPSPVSSSSSRVTYKSMIDFKDPRLNRLWSEGFNFLQAGHFVSPAGANAVERYLAVYNALRSTPNADPVLLAGAQDALRSLFPYVLMSAEAAVERNDAPEASRLVALMHSIDPSSPSLPRMTAAVQQMGTTPTLPAALSETPPPTTP